MSDQNPVQESTTAAANAAEEHGGATQAPANENGTDNPAASVRLEVLKTYKLYLGGKFPRTESGRYLEVRDKEGKLVANVCRASRKDFRNAVVAARAAFPGWAGRAALNRGQILYRIAEMLEGRKAQLISELVEMGMPQAEASADVAASVDRMVYYAGWCDKYQQVFSAVNAVASSHFNFSLLEPTGVVGIYAPQNTGLLGLVSVIAPVIAGGNTCVVMSGDGHVLNTITLGEILNSSDVPGGVVNLLTGDRAELVKYFSSHMDVNAYWLCDGDAESSKNAQISGVENVKRVKISNGKDWSAEEGQSPYLIHAFQEVKTTWHPVGI